MKKVILFIFLIEVLSGCQKETLVSLVNEEIEVNSKVEIKDIVKNEEGIKIINENDIIDTTKIGSKEVIIKFIDKKGKERYTSFPLEVVDKTAPNIEYPDNVELIVNSEDELLKNVKVVDNYSSDIKLEIVGDYDLNTPGEYDLKLMAQDESGNKTEKSFILKVKNINMKTTGYYVYKTKETWFEISFLKNNKVLYLPWYCPGYGCGGYSMEGSYKINGNKLTANFTHDTNDLGIRQKLKENVVWNFTITSENQIIKDGKKFNWQKTFEE